MPVFTTQVWADNEPQSHDIYQWDTTVRCTIDDDGSWRIKSASVVGFTEKNVQGIQSGHFVQIPPTIMQLCDTEEDKTERAQILAQDMILNRVWEASIVFHMPQ